jgi:hypothetical protein
MAMTETLVVPLRSTTMASQPAMIFLLMLLFKRIEKNRPSVAKGLVVRRTTFRRKVIEIA